MLLVKRIIVMMCAKNYFWRTAWPPKRRGAWGSLPPYPTLSTGLVYLPGLIRGLHNHSRQNFPFDTFIRGLRVRRGSVMKLKATSQLVRTVILRYKNLR